MRRSIGFLASLLGLATLALVVWWLRASEPDASKPDERPPYVLPVTLASVKRGDLRPSTRLTGSVRSPTQAGLAFTVDGLVEALYVREPDRVRAGDELARIRSRDRELRLASAQADLVLAQRELEKLRAGTRAEEKRRLTAVRDEVRALEVLAGVEVERGRRLIEDRVVSEADLDRLLAQHEVARARAEAAEHKLSEAKAGTRAEDLAIAEAQVEVGRAAVELAQEEVDKTRLRAPADTIVLDRRVSVGDYVSSGQVVFDVVDLGQLEIAVEIPSRFAALLEENSPVRLTADDVPGFEIDTTLDALIPVADERSRNFRGLVRLERGGASEALVPGMFVRVELFLMNRTNALLVPSDAIRSTEGRTVVVCALEAESQLTARWVTVRVLGSDGTRSAVEPLGGELVEGQRVVVTGVDLAFPGAPLLPRAEADPEETGDAELAPPSR